MDLRALDRLGDEIAELSVHLEAATARLLDLIREFDARGGWNNGFRSCAEWLSWRVGLDLGAAREKVRVARALATLPRLAQALARGELSYAKVRALTRVATPETEERLLAIGRAGTAEHVERIVRGWRRMDRKAERDEAARQHASRALYVYPAEDGTVTIRGRLAPEAGALLLKALTAAREALYQRARREVADRGRLEATTSPRNRRRWPSSRPTPCSCWRRPRCTTASIPARRPSTTRWWSTSTPRSWQTPINPASPSSKMARAFLQKRLSALACDASRVVMRHDAEGRIFEVGAKTRTIPPALRRALLHRDRSCRFPGCHGRFCQAHHIRHWAQGGPTTLSNLVLLCRRHHRAVHEEGYQVDRQPDGELRFRRPDGRVVPDVPSPPPAPPDPAERCQSAERCGRDRGERADRHSGLAGGAARRRLRDRRAPSAGEVGHEVGSSTWTAIPVSRLYRLRSAEGRRPSAPMATA